jgi:hypothetical protein
MRNPLAERLAAAPKIYRDAAQKTKPSIGLNRISMLPHALKKNAQHLLINN